MNKRFIKLISYQIESIQDDVITYSCRYSIEAKTAPLEIWVTTSDNLITAFIEEINKLYKDCNLSVIYKGILYTLNDGNLGLQKLY